MSTASEREEYKRVVESVDRKLSSHLYSIECLRKAIDADVSDGKDPLAWKELEDWEQENVDFLRDILNALREHRDVKI